MASTSSPGRLSRWLHALTIVPGAHVRVLDSELQGEMYEVFHTGRLSRWGHAICTPIVNVALLALAAQLSIGLSTGSEHVTIVDGATAAALITLVCYLAVHGAWAIAMAPVLAIATILAHLLAGALGPRAASIALAIAIGGATVQTWTHALEPVPPPWSSSHSFEPVDRVLARTPISKLALLTFSLLVLFPILELWASPRVWPLQIAKAIERLGLMRERAARLRGRVYEIHRDARVAWAAPDPI